MTTQPEALRLADYCDGNVLYQPAATLLRTQHAEIERLNAAIKWEQNRAERIGTHGPGCEKWGSAHFECALRAMERKDALLRQALDQLTNMQPIIANGLLTTRQLQFIDPHIDAAVTAIKEAL